MTTTQPVGTQRAATVGLANLSEHLVSELSSIYQAVWLTAPRAHRPTRPRGCVIPVRWEGTRCPGVPEVCLGPCIYPPASLTALDSRWRCIPLLCSSIRMDPVLPRGASAGTQGDWGCVGVLRPAQVCLVFPWGIQGSDPTGPKPQFNPCPCHSVYQHPTAPYRRAWRPGSCRAQRSK